MRWRLTSKSFLVPTLGLILARGGSKGLPGKNIRPLGGKPLLAWTIEAAQQCGMIDRLVISTDDPAIAAIAKRYGCEVPFVRPKALATDESSAVDATLHALDTLGAEYDLLVLLQPTSPLRSPTDIAACVQTCLLEGVPSCLTVTRASESPFWMFAKSPVGELHPIVAMDHMNVRRQDLPPAFLINGAVYAIRTDWLKKHRSFVGPGTRGYEMPAERSVDIDTLEDFQTAENLLKSHAS